VDQLVPDQQEGLDVDNDDSIYKDDAGKLARTVRISKPKMTSQTCRLE